MSDVLVIKTNARMGLQTVEKLSNSFKKQKEQGVVILPDDVEIRVEGGDRYGSCKEM